MQFPKNEFKKMLITFARTSVTQPKFDLEV